LVPEGKPDRRKKGGWLIQGGGGKKKGSKLTQGGQGGKNSKRLPKTKTIENEGCGRSGKIRGMRVRAAIETTTKGKNTRREEEKILMSTVHGPPEKKWTLHMEKGQNAKKEVTKRKRVTSDPEAERSTEQKKRGNLEKYQVLRREVPGSRRGSSPGCQYKGEGKGFFLFEGNWTVGGRGGELEGVIGVALREWRRGGPPAERREGNGGR